MQAVMALIRRMYELRDKAFQDWLRESGRENMPIDARDLAKRAFIAGWKARKDEQYKAIVGVIDVAAR